MLTDTRGASHTQVAVDIDLADSHRSSLSEHIFGYADRVFERAAVLVDDLYEFLRNGRSAVQDYREVGQSLSNFFENVESELRLGARLELVSAVRSTDRDSKAVNAGLGNEFFYFFGSGVGAVLSGDLDLVFNACKSAQLAFYYDAVVVSVFDYLAGKFNVILESVMAAVDHDGVETAVDTALAKLERIAVIEVQTDGQVADFFSSFYHLAKIGGVSVLSRAGRNLKNERSVLFGCRFYDTLNDFHIVYVESADSVTALVCLLKHIGRCNQWHKNYLQNCYLYCSYRAF